MTRDWRLLGLYLLGVLTVISFLAGWPELGSALLVVTLLSAWPRLARWHASRKPQFHSPPSSLSYHLEKRRRAAEEDARYAPVPTHMDAEGQHHTLH